MKFFDFFEIENKIEIMDVGAAAINETPVYQKIIDIGFANLNAFEGDVRHSKKLMDKYGEKLKLYSQFVFDGTTQNLYKANEKYGMTSLLKPKLNALNFFNGFNKLGEIEKIEKVKTYKLNDIEELPLIDLSKMDIQGSELTVLNNGLEKLKDCLAVQLEVSYISLYENQPTFGEVDIWMRSKGYSPHCFLYVKRWSITPTIFNNNFRVPGNQLLESDIVYIKDPLKLNLLNNEQLKKFITISHYCFKSIDLCVFILLELEKRNVIPKSSFAEYLSNIEKLGINNI